MTDCYESPLTTRYASREMGSIFSARRRAIMWRRVWVALARAQMEVGLCVTEAQIEELESQIESIDFARIAELESELLHDIMAHIHAYAEQCPTAAPIIHLGATSCLVTDNADVVLMREALELLVSRLTGLLRALGEKADQFKSLPCLSFTHFQAAQPTTVGRRMALWAQDFLMDLEELDARLHHLRFLGVKGATGTQASFLQLLEGDGNRVCELEGRFVDLLGGGKVFPLAGQTYSRKQDAQLLDALAGIATSAHKMATDLRLLAHLQEVHEPFGKRQVGSSAMPYKRNPMQCERACSLARYLMALAENPRYTAATQWFERTLDDSANRRLCIPQAFLAADAILCILTNVVEGLEVHEATITANLERKLPILACEQVLMASVKRGCDRQIVHERLRLHAMAEGSVMAQLAADPQIPLESQELQSMLDAKIFIGRSAEQVTEFLQSHLFPNLTKEIRHADRPIL